MRSFALDVHAPRGEKDHQKVDTIFHNPEIERDFGVRQDVVTNEVLRFGRQDVFDEVRMTN